MHHMGGRPRFKGRDEAHNSKVLRRDKSARMQQKQRRKARLPNTLSYATGQSIKIQRLPAQHDLTTWFNGKDAVTALEEKYKELMRMRSVKTVTKEKAWARVHR